MLFRSVAAGALTGWLSGSGSSVLCVARPAKAAKVARAMVAAFAGAGVKGGRAMGATDEQAALPANIAVFHVEPLTVPGLHAERCLVWMREAAPRTPRLVHS